MISQEQISEINKRIDQLFNFLDITNKKENLDLFEKEMLQNNFWENPKNAEKTLKSKKELENWINAFNEIENNVEELNILIELGANDNEIDTKYKKTKHSYTNG